MKKERKSTAKPAAKDGLTKPGRPATKTAGKSATRDEERLQAIGKLHSLFRQAYRSQSPLHVEDTDVQGVRDLHHERVRQREALSEKIELAKECLLATEYDVPPSWLTVQTVGILRYNVIPATEDKPALAVLTDSGADRPTLYKVIAEMYVAALRLKVKIGQKADQVTGQTESRGKEQTATTAAKTKGYMTPRSLAEMYGLPLEALRKRLARWRKKNGEGWTDNTDATSTEARHLYLPTSVAGVIEKMINDLGKASSKRPA